MHSTDENVWDVGGGQGLDLSGSGQESVARSCERGRSHVPKRQQIS
jgi:hypothetical protein